MGSAPQPISADPTLAKKLGLLPLKSDVGTTFDPQNGPDLSRFKAHIVSLNAEQYSIDPSDTPLPEPSNRLTSSSMTVTREEIDAKIAASEARTETRLAEMNGKFDLMLSKMDALHSEVVRTEKRVDSAKWTMIAVFIAAVFAGAGLLASGIGVGSAFRDIVRQEVQALAPSSPAVATTDQPVTEPPTPPQQ